MLWFRLILAVPLMLLLGGWLNYSAIRALMRGEANAGGIRVRKHARPVFFAIALLVQFGFGMMSLYLAGTVLLDILGRS